MNRRYFFLSLTASLCAIATGGSAQTVQDQVITQLKQQGFSRITVRRTFLGRVRILAEGSQGRREIVLNPGTGAILRDYYDHDDNDNRADSSNDSSDDDSSDSSSGDSSNDDHSSDGSKDSSNDDDNSSDSSDDNSSDDSGDDSKDDSGDDGKDDSSDDSNDDD